ncbi:LysR family transcriptional regulator [Falsochrobactrum sp. TDYN1]|uniref:LysR family transcriptional regulator n=1 Tax=Falsochrobactrum tianjinense TaxID=2706015 RepID=A0A949UT12_9HYPH|nr:LysR family transcriptional regulator [Falsochrobactrum sp. TDYN1]MBV2143474.1 LysR family transcriptional regulator [Falsochrobactrum sp. TDYN1]
MAGKRRNKAFFGTVSDTDLRLMRVFSKVVECGSFSAAETELGVGRSTISRHLSDLETRLGVRLCHRQRGRSGLRLTEQGSLALEYIEQLLIATNEFSINISSITDDIVGTLRVGVVDYTFSDPQNPLLDALHRYALFAPNVIIDISVGAPREIERKLIDGRLHCGIVMNYQMLPELSYERLYVERNTLYAGGNHPVARKIRNGEQVSEAEVYRYELIYRGYREADIQIDLKQRFARGPTVLETEAVDMLVRSGIYLGFLPSHTRSPQVDGCVEVLPHVFEYRYPINLVWSKNRDHSALLEEFLRIIRATKKDAAHSGF